MHWIPQLPVELQVAVALAGAVHGLQSVPQELGLVFDRHWPLQLWLPLGQTPPQAAPVGMQSLPHNLYPFGQAGTQLPLVQLALPPVGTEQTVHDEPQNEIELSSAQTFPQRWKPVLQEMPQVWPALQVAVPLAGLGHSAAAQQVPVAVEMQAPLHWR